MHSKRSFAYQCAGNYRSDLDIGVLLEVDQHTISCAAGLARCDVVVPREAAWVQAVDLLGTSVLVQTVSVHVPKGEVARARVSLRVAVSRCWRIL